MIFAEKIIALRKKNGWSQEELAEKMNVSRQSVSKWEGAQSVPDLSKVLLLGQLFGVSTDYLLKDEMEDAEYLGENKDEETTGVRKVSLEEANAFLSAKAETAPRIALGVLLCVLAPVCLILLGAASDGGMLSITENMAGAIGLIALILMVAPAVGVFIACGMKTSPYEYLEKEPIETEYGVTGMVREKQRQYKETYTRKNITAACVCVLSVVPLLTAACVTENDFTLAASLSLTLLLAGVGAGLFITAGVPWASMQKLLQEGDYTAELKRNSHWRGSISTAYWLVVVAGYLGYSLYTNDWKMSWVVWPVAGVLYAALVNICGAFKAK